MAVYDQAGNLTHVGRRGDLTPVLPQDGTTGLGTPRKTGPAASAPADSPQQALPGDTGRQVVKASQATTPEQVIRAYGPEWMPVHDWAGRLAGAVRKSHVTPIAEEQVLKGAAGRSRANVYDARRRRGGTAPPSRIVQLADLMDRPVR